METGSIYERDENMRPDSEFLAGSLEFLVPGNEGRMLDARRTPIRIESYTAEGALLRLRILKFEDTGTVWELPAEQIDRFQFERSAKRLEGSAVRRIAAAVETFSEHIHIEPRPERREAAVLEQVPAARRWLAERSEFVRRGVGLEFQARTGPDTLRRDCTEFLIKHGVGALNEEIALQWACQNGGEAIKALQTRMADMGLVEYKGQRCRNQEVASRLGKDGLLDCYITSRLAFVRAVWQTLRVEHLTLYRGMSSDRGWRGKPRAWSSWTPVQHVARCHADFDSFGQHRGASTDSYLFKRTFPVSKIFMSYFETDAFNRQWKETEVLVMHDDADRPFL